MGCVIHRLAGVDQGIGLQHQMVAIDATVTEVLNTGAVDDDDLAVDQAGCGCRVGAVVGGAAAVAGSGTVVGGTAIPLVHQRLRSNR